MVFVRNYGPVLDPFERVFAATDAHSDATFVGQRAAASFSRSNRVNHSADNRLELGQRRRRLHVRLLIRADREYVHERHEFAAFLDRCYSRSLFV